MAFFEQPPQLTDYIIGKMKLTKREGDYDGFLAARGVPYAIRLLKQIPVGATQRWASEVRDGVLWLTQTELGTFGNTEKEPFPLDGKTWVRDVAPSGSFAESASLKTSSRLNGSENLTRKPLFPVSVAASSAPCRA